AIGFIVQKVLFNIEPQTILLERLLIGRFITEHIPHLLTLPRARHSKMHRTIALFSDGHLLPETGLPPGHGEALDFAARTPTAIEPKAPLDPNPPMPAQSLEIRHQLGIRKATIGQQDHCAALRHQEGRSLQEVLVDLERHLRTAMMEHTPHQWDSP